MQLDKMTRILFICQDLGIGGAEEVMAVGIKYLNKNKYSVQLCCIGKKNTLGEELKKQGYEVFELCQNYTSINILIIYRLYKYIKKCKPHIIHTSLFYANFYGRIAARLAGVPIVVIEEQNINAWKYNNMLFVLADKVLSYITNRIIACSETVKDFTAKQEHIRDDKFVVIYNTFDIQRFKCSLSDRQKIRSELGIESNYKLIGTIGRLCEQKGHINLINTMPLIVKQFPGCKLCIVGDGPLEHALKMRVQELGLVDTVMFMNKRRDISSVLAAFDIFVFPSLWEGLPVVLLEAMYMAKPIVATQIPSNNEVIINNETGILVTDRNKNALAEKIVSLLCNSREAERLGIAAKQRAEKCFGPEEHVKQLESLYEELIKEKSLQSIMF